MKEESTRLGTMTPHQKSNSTRRIDQVGRLFCFVHTCFKKPTAVRKTVLSGASSLPTVHGSHRFETDSHCLLFQLSPRKEKSDRLDTVCVCVRARRWLYDPAANSTVQSHQRRKVKRPPFHMYTFSSKGEEGKKKRKQKRGKKEVEVSGGYGVGIRTTCFTVCSSNSKSRGSLHAFFPLFTGVQAAPSNMSPQQHEKEQKKSRQLFF